MKSGKQYSRTKAARGQRGKHAATPIGDDARLAALAALKSVLDHQQSLAEHPWPDLGSHGRNVAFARHLAYGVLRWLPALEWLAAQLIERPLKRRDRDIQRLILIGLFQLWHEGTAEHAAIHATTECARKCDKPWAVGLVNGVLRQFQRQQSELLAKLEQHDARHAHPDWMVQRLRKDWPEQWQEIVQQNNQHAPLWLRVNQQRSNRADVQALIKTAEMESSIHEQAPWAVMLPQAVAAELIPGFTDGLVSVQDPAAQLAAELLQPQPGMRVLDACAAPGGKTCHLLEACPEIDLLALDRDPARIGMINENLARLGLSCTVQAADAGDPDAWWDGKGFDRILLDAPCSATGVIRRHPEIKNLRTPEQVLKAQADQHRLLDRLWPLLNSGGILVYATCSLFKSENHEQIHAFLQRHEDASLAGPAQGRQIMPGEAGMDGFYYAVLHQSAG